MIVNVAMENILADISLDDVHVISDYPIWEKKTLTGLPYWGTGDFCVIDEQPISENRDLTALEWDENEIYISGMNNILELVKQGLGIILVWKTQMKQEHSETSFDILLSVDEGENDVSPSVTLRFWAIRNGIHYVEPAAEILQKFSQPVLMEQVNYNI